MKNNCGKLCALVVGSALAVSTINVSVFAETIEPEVISVIGNRMIETRINTDSELPQGLKEYICVFGADNSLKTVSVVDAQTEDRMTIFSKGLNTSEDYVKIFIWDDNMMPYGNSVSVQLKDVKHRSGGVDGGGGGGCGHSSVVVAATPIPTSN